MATQSSGRDPVEKLAEEFADRFRRGERPSLAEYTARYPELADQIRELFPALVEMEQLASVDGPCTGPYTPAGSGNGGPPQQLGEYRILREIGHGGMGVVYEAVQESLGRHVALKVLPLHGLLNPTHRERFRREAKAAARLHHTNIVPVFGVGEDNGIHYYAMQFIQGQGLDMVLEEVRRLRAAPGAAAPANPAPGRELSECVARGLLTGQFARPEPDAAKALAAETASTVCARPVALEIPPGQPPTGDGSTLVDGADRSHLTNLTETQYFRSLAQVAVQVAEALAYAHKQGILHRDVKPSNLLLDAAGTVWITDFGLAKAEDSDDLTQTGDLVGTLRYMAPERFQEQSDRRSDVYGLGITLYELLTLRPAFEDANRARLIERVTHDEPPRPRKLDVHIPRDLETIVLKAIAKDPAARYPTAEALAEDLRRFLADRPIRARRTSWQERTWRWCRRNPVVASLSGTVVALLLVVAVGSTVAALRLSAQGERLRDQLGRTRRAEREGQEKLFQAHLAQARAARFSGQVGQRFASLDALAEAAQIAHALRMPKGRLLELRNEAVACLALADLRPPSFPYRCSAGPHDGLWFDDSFQRYATWDGQGRVRIRRLSDDRELPAIPGPGVPVEYVRFSPDGRSVVVNTVRYGEKRQGKCHFWNLETGKKTLQLPGNVMFFTPDGRRAWVWLSLESGELELYDLASGRRERRFVVGPGWHSLALHPDGRLIAETSGKSGGLRVWDTRTGKVTRTLPVPGQGGVVVWHPSGRLLAVTGPNDNTIETWDVERGRRQAVLRGHQSRIGIVVFNHGGDLLASTGWDEILRLWDPLTGKLLLSKEGGLWTPQFSRDDRLLGPTYNGARWEVWEVTRGGTECRVLAGPPDSGGIYGADFGLGGRLLACTGDDGVRLWDRDTNREVAFLGIGAMDFLLFDPVNGSLLTAGRRGLERWPVVSGPREGAAGAGVPLHLKIGPPQWLHPPSGRKRFDLSAEGRRLVISDWDRSQAFVFDPRGRAEKVVLQQPHLAHVAISPEGRWVATATWWGGRTAVVKVWEARRGACVRELQVGGDALVTFSGDGRWLATGTRQELCLWRVGTWERGRVINAGGGAGVLAFSPDGRVLAVARTRFLVQLLDPDTGAELASLAVPDPQGLVCLRFSADGGLLVAGRDNQECHVWDLRAIRYQLDKMGLDWDRPPYPPTAPQKATPPLTVSVDYGTSIVLSHPREAVGVYSLAIGLWPLNPEPYLQRGRAFGQLRQAQKAIADYSMCLALTSPADKRRPEILFRRFNNYLALHQQAAALTDLLQLIRLNLDGIRVFHAEVAQSCNDLAWQLVTGPAKERDPAKALPLARKAVELTPQETMYLNTLGVAQYRNGKYTDAVGTLEKSLAASKGERDAFDLFFLAMCHHHLGNAPKAKDCFDRAVKWCQRHKDLPADYAAELKAFQAEAEKLLRRT
jgi:serine/threonine protein kinase/WD40 repeat protein